MNVPDILAWPALTPLGERLLRCHHGVAPLPEAAPEALQHRAHQWAEFLTVCHMLATEPQAALPRGWHWALSLDAYPGEPLKPECWYGRAVGPLPDGEPQWFKEKTEKEVERVEQAVCALLRRCPQRPGSAKGLRPIFREEQVSVDPYSPTESAFHTPCTDQGASEWKTWLHRLEQQLPDLMILEKAFQAQSWAETLPAASPRAAPRL